jgi:hypothetical protein
VLNETSEMLDGLAEQLMRLLSPEDIAKRLVDLMKNAKNEAVSQGIIRDILEYCGQVTEKERMRAKHAEQPSNAPMFVWAKDVQISFGPTPIGRDEGGLHNPPSVKDALHIDVESRDTKDTQ